MAVRTALGAGRGRLVRQLLTESVMLGLLGAGFGLLFAVWGVEILIGMQPQGIPRLDDVSVDRTVVIFAVSLAVLTGLVFGLVPAMQSTRGGVAGTLKESGRGALTSRSGSRVRSALVIAEMALAVMLLAGAGLLIRSFTRLAAVDPGFRVEPALTFELSLPDSRYEQEPQQVMFFDQLLPRLKSIPGVRSAGGILSLPLSGTQHGLELQGRRPAARPACAAARHAGAGGDAGIFLDDRHSARDAGGCSPIRIAQGSPPVVLHHRGGGQAVLPERGAYREENHVGLGTRARARRAPAARSSASSAT